MKILVKNLHNQQFTVDCDEDNSIKELKEKIAAQKEIEEKYDPELIKLLYGGKVMDDEDAVSNYTIKPDGYVVLIKQLPGKPKPPPKKKPYQGFNNNMGFGAGGMSGFGSNGFGGLGGFGSGGLMQTPFQQDPFGTMSFQQNPFPQTSANPSAFSNSSFGPGSSLSSSASKSEPQSHNPFPDANPDDFSTPQDREEALRNLLAMGFNKEQSEKALRASFYNVEGAIEHITSGNIPNVPDRPAAPQPTPSSGPVVQQQRQPTQQPNPAATRQPAGSGGMGANLQQMRQMLQQNPEQLQIIKQTIQAEHPEIAQMIDENPQGFLDLLNQVSDEAPNDDLPASSGGSGGNPSGRSPTGSSSAAGAGRSLSTREEEIISRFQAMGFDRNRAIEAYFTCNRDENMAANYLINTLD